MERILFINGCSRPDSRTLRLAREVLQQLSGTVEEVSLFAQEVPLLGPETMERWEKGTGNQDFSDSLFDFAKQFSRADTVVLAAPYWNLMFPARLMCYLEMITVSGITFRYSDKGIPESLCHGRRLYYVTTSGGFIGQNDFGYRYVKTLFGSFFGITDSRRFCAQGLDIYGADVEALLQTAIDEIRAATRQKKTIPYPEKYGSTPLQDGASAFDGKLNRAHSRYYVANDFFNMQSDATLHILSRFQTYQQTTEYTCGAACALMVLNWFGKEKYHENALGSLLETHPCKGSSVENIADLFDLLGFRVDFHAGTDLRFRTVEQAEKMILDYIDRGIPILVDWVDWAGHWQVLVGIDTCGTDSPYDDVLIFADPYDVTDHKQDGYYTYPLGRFFGMWREGPCAEKAEPYQQPFVAAWPREL